MIFSISRCRKSRSFALAVSPRRPSRARVFSTPASPIAICRIFAFIASRRLKTILIGFDVFLPNMANCMKMKNPLGLINKTILIFLALGSKRKRTTIATHSAWMQRRVKNTRKRATSDSRGVVIWRQFITTVMPSKFFHKCRRHRRRRRRRRRRAEKKRKRI